MDDPAVRWIEFTTHDGRASRLRVDQIGMVSRVTGANDAGVIHTSLGELIRVLDVTHVLQQWRHRLLFVVARTALNSHSYLRQAFADVDWADVIFDRRTGDRRQRQSPSAVDRRTGTTRRGRPDIDERVRTFGWAVVRVNRA
jgi:hypothetical protein